MALMPEFIKGTCNRMCPKEEENLRTKERILHYYELNPLTTAATTKHLLVKSFSRSAAGCKQPKPCDLRTIPALEKTVDYLLGTIFIDTRRSYSFVYDFIFDRLRAIRQEIVMQNIDTLNTIKLLQPIVMFLAYSLYRLCEETTDTFDPKICTQHLQECLKKLLCCYEEMDRNNKFDTMYNKNNRIFIECIYLTLNLGNVEALVRGISMGKEIRSHNLFKTCLIMSIEYLNPNFYRVLHKMNQLPHLIAALVALKLPIMRQKLLHQFSVSYKQLPLVWCQNVLMYSKERQFRNDCRAYGIEIDVKTKTITFVKGKFNLNGILVNLSHEHLVDEKLVKENLSDIILML